MINEVIDEFDPFVARGVSMHISEWRQLEAAAKKENRTVSNYIRTKLCHGGSEQ